MDQWTNPQGTHLPGLMASPLQVPGPGAARRSGAAWSRVTSFGEGSVLEGKWDPLVQGNHRTSPQMMV